VIRVDNKSIIELVKNPINYQKTRWCSVSLHPRTCKRGECGIRAHKKPSTNYRYVHNPSTFENNKTMLGMKDKKKI